MSAPSNSATQTAPKDDPTAHLAGAKALLAKKMTQNNNATVMSSPTDNMMTPATARINQVKKKHFNKGKPLRGPLFAMAGAPPAKDEHETGEASKAES